MHDIALSPPRSKAVRSALGSNKPAPPHSENPARMLEAPPAFLDLLPIAVYACDAQGRVRWFNQRAVDLWGRPLRIGDDIELFCRSYKPASGEITCAEAPMAHALKTGEPVHGAQGVVERPDGSCIWTEVHIDPVKDANGKLLGAINCFHDITRHKHAEERQKVLLDELNHRVNNTLATVQSLAAHTIRGSAVPVDLCDAFEARLLALSQAHDQLTRARWQSADLRLILEAVFAPYNANGGDRVRLTGEPVKLAPQVALTLTMVLHELATNAAKYGSLSVPEGAMVVSWTDTMNGGGRGLRIEWQESGGPAVRQPERRGFGTRLIERAIIHELKGSVQILFEPAGVRCSMGLPLPARDA